MAALLPEHPSPETTAQFEALEKLARAPEEGLPQTSRRIPPSEIILSAGAAIMPSDVADYALGRVLELAARTNGIPVGINTAEATKRLVALFKAQQ